MVSRFDNVCDKVFKSNNIITICPEVKYSIVDDIASWRRTGGNLREERLVKSNSVYSQFDATRIFIPKGICNTDKLLKISLQLWSLHFCVLSQLFKCC